MSAIQYPNERGTDTATGRLNGSDWIKKSPRLGLKMGVIYVACDVHIGERFRRYLFLWFLPVILIARFNGQDSLSNQCLLTTQ